MSEPSQVAETIAENVSTVVEQTIEAAEQRAEVAEEIAEALTEAAFRDQLYQRVDNAVRDIETWRGELLSRVSDQAATIARLEEQLSMLTAPPPSQSLPVIVQTEAPSIPSPPPETPEPTTSAIDPATGEAAPEEAKTNDQPAARRRHRAI